MLGFTTNGFGPDLPDFPSAVRLGPAPGGGIGVFPTGLAAACGPAGRWSSDGPASIPGASAAGFGGTSVAPRFGNRSLASGLMLRISLRIAGEWMLARRSAPNWCNNDENSLPSFLGMARSSQATVRESYSSCVIKPDSQSTARAPSSSGIVWPPSPVETRNEVTKPGTPCRACNVLIPLAIDPFLAWSSEKL